ncbi:AraC family transcriptional regulator [Streptomyces sp. SBT349]|uniref:AraC family transcriptional regulator n=1 Tax=Streptomyces sp. SBT349 TaxID=1580539 RepID=UPI00066A7F6F|nr:AraC family transcriptional regulator [Streptomyces sp. SBT349]
MLERLNQAMDHIERNLDRRVDAAELARITLTSEYHFRRLFSALAGMPLSEYIRRRRLTVAGAEVLAGRMTLLDVALHHGYGSGESFARAFRAMHGVGPHEARAGGAPLHSQPRMSFRLIVEGRSSMRYRITEKESFRLVGRKARVPLVHEGLNPAIVAFVRSIPAEAMDRLVPLSDQEPRGIVTAADNAAGHEEGSELDYWQGVVTGAAPGADAVAEGEGTESLDVPAGTWAVFESSGAFPVALQYVWRDVFTQWFPSNPYRTRPGPEIVSTRLSEDRERADAELWIPVERV